jgi:hypothetical protein
MFYKKELRELVEDYGGGRGKKNAKSQFFYDCAKKILREFDLKAYSEIEMFAEYLKEVGKNTSAHHHTGLEPIPD